MGMKTVFVDENNNEMECHLNDNDMLYIDVRQSDEPMTGGYIVLEKSDVQQLIKMLTEFEKQMND